MAQLRSEQADRLLLNRQRLEEEHATLVEAQAQVCVALDLLVSYELSIAACHFYLLPVLAAHCGGLLYAADSLCL